MQLNRINNISFGSAQLNIVSMADNHGNFLGIPQVIETIKVNSDDIFEKSKQRSTKNILAIVGDYFMNPLRKGLLTNKSKTTGDIQYMFLHQLILNTRRAAGAVGNFEALYGIGNHCYGGGDDWLYTKLKNISGMITIISNFDLKKSPFIKNLVETTKKFALSKVYQIPDDKNPDKFNKVLFLSLTIPSTYYNPHSLKLTHFIDETDKNDVAIKETDLKNTIKHISKQVENFKKENPNGAVVLMSHMGNPISAMFAKNIPDIDIILNAHDHKDYILKIGKTLILSHGQNNKFIRATNIRFNDDGEIEDIKQNKYETVQYDYLARRDKDIEPFVQKTLKDDLVPLVRFTQESGNTEEMLYDNTIRYQNSVLANYITSGLKTAVNKTYPEVDSVGIPSTIIRNGLKSHFGRTTFNNIDLMDMFKGVDENNAGLKIGTLKGEEIVKYIAENVKNNLKSKTRNALIQWSDFQVNRTLLEKMFNGKIKKDLYSAIKIRNTKTGEFEKMNPEENYTIIMSNKHLQKKGRNYRTNDTIRDKFRSIPYTYEELFREYLNIIDKKVKISDLHREKRIL